VYKHLLQFIDEAYRQAKDVMNRLGVRKLLTTSFADVDLIQETIQLFDSSLNNIDTWGLQIYRGKNFGTGSDNILLHWKEISSMPLIVTEYGVDSYRDECGNCSISYCPNPCYNNITTSFTGYSREDEIAQADWDESLSLLLMSSWEDRGVLGGYLMSWNDEYWKNQCAVKGCNPRYTEVGFNPMLCEYKGHVDCPCIDVSSNCLCGYALESTYDGYVNEGWYGINRVIRGGNAEIDRLDPREIYYRLQRIYGMPCTRPSSIPSTFFKYNMGWTILAILLFSIGTVPLILYECMKYYSSSSNQLHRHLLE